LNFTRKQRGSPAAGGCIFGQEKDATKGRTPCGFACGLPAWQGVCALPRPRKKHNLEVILLRVRGIYYASQFTSHQIFICIFYKHYIGLAASALDSRWYEFSIF
jgi:hypothetical protein